MTAQTCDRIVCGSTHDMLAVVVTLVVAAIISAAAIWLIESADGRSLTRRRSARDEEQKDG